MKSIFLNVMLLVFLVSTIFTLNGCGTNDDNQTVYDDESSTYKPHITLYGDTNVTINLGVRSIDGDEYGYEAYDPQDGDITDKVKVVNNIDFNRAGQYRVTYSVTDSDGNKDVKYRYINIVDNSTNSSDNADGDPYYGGQTYIGSIPTITITDGDTLYLPLGRTFTPSATAKDIEDGDLTSSIEIGGDRVNVNQEGTYVVTYTVTDSSGNTVSKNQTIFVGDYGSSSDYTYTTTNSLDDFKTWYKTECGGTFNSSLYNANTGYYNGDINCENRGLYNIDLNYISIFSTIKALNLSHNNLSEIDFTPLAKTSVIEKIDLSYNKFSYIDFSPLYNLKNINELWINNNDLHYTEEERVELYRGFNNRSFTIYF